MTKYLTILCALALLAGLIAVGCQPAEPEMAQPHQPAEALQPAAPSDVSADVSAPPTADVERGFSAAAISEPGLQGEQKACPKCGGQGTTSCIRCNGNGNQTCGFCWGSGSVDVNCRSCNGTGKIQGQTCSTCNGQRTVTEQCDNCSGVGHFVCGRCGGQGVETCSICRGTGVNPIQ